MWAGKVERTLRPGFPNLLYASSGREWGGGLLINWPADLIKNCLSAEGRMGAEVSSSHCEYELRVCVHVCGLGRGVEMYFKRGWCKWLAYVKGKNFPSAV